MAHALDHVFVLCDVGAPEAESLLRLGLREGSGNTHPGQGTACRRFFFGNAYLELLWVSDPAEAQGPMARPTRLWDRWVGRRSVASPFGVVLRPSGTVPREPPFASWAYCPPYLPTGVAIEIAVGTRLSEPELFYWRLPRRPDALGKEPIDHARSWREITKLTMGMPEHAERTPAIQAVERTGLVSFEPSVEHVLSLELDDRREGGVVDLRPLLPLVLRS